MFLFVLDTYEVMSTVNSGTLVICLTVFRNFVQVPLLRTMGMSGSLQTFLTIGLQAITSVRNEIK